MKSFLPTLVLVFLTHHIFSQGCTVTETAPRDTIVCGESVFLSAHGQGQGIALLSENFNNGTYGPGWAATQQAMWNNPCSANGVDGTTHIWMGNSSPVPRILTTTSFNLSSCVNAGVTICFDMLFATQGNNAPCEGPDEPDEGVYLQYSTDGGNTWIDIHYFDPNGGQDPQLINWNNWCFAVPAAALTANTKFRWFQDADSGADYDHWGIDNVVIYCNDPSYNIVWQHDGYNAGPVGGTNPNAVAPHSTTDYIVVMSNGTTTCRDTVHLVVIPPTFVVNAGNDTSVCTGQCATINATAKVIIHPARTLSYFNHEFQPVNATFGAVTSININVQGLNMSNVLSNSIASVCIDGLTFFGFGGFPPAQVDVGDLQISLVCPDGTRIILLPSGVTSNSSGGGYTNTCFVTGGSSIASGTSPYSGSYSPSQPLNNFVGCSANGLWTMEIQMSSAAGFGLGTFSGWSITFNDPEVSYTGNYSWAPTTGMTNSNSLSPTVCPPPTAYTITLSDTAGCATVTDVVNVTTHSCCTLSATATTTQPTCGGSNGAINITPVPAGSYTFAWSDGPSTSQNRTGLAAGTYTVTVTSTVTPTCTFDTTITLNSNSSLVASLTNPINPTCAGNDGSITAGVSGGTAPYQVTIDTGGTPFTITVPFAASQNIPGLDAGTVNVSVTDAASCTATATATLTAPTNCCTLSATSTTTQPTCGGSNGAINITPTPSGSYTYAWSDGPSTLQNRTGLAAGSYTVTITSTTVATCTFLTTITLNSNSSLTATLTNPVNPTCAGNDGSITAGVSGGTAPYQVTIDTGGTPFTITVPVAGSQTITGLHAGTVSISVTDAASCTASATATLTAPVSVTATLTNPVNPTCAGNDGSITATLAGGTAPYQVTIDTGGTPFTITVPIAGSQTITGLHAGTISISVTDANSCVATANATLTAATNCCTHTVSAVFTQPACGQNNGDIALTTANGSGSYSYNWGGGQTTSSITGVGAGNYPVTITDNGVANCFIDTTFSLNSNSNLSLTFTNAVNPTCANNDGSITANLSGGTGPYTITVDTGGTPVITLPAANSGPYSFTGLHACTINASVTDANGCQSNATATLTMPAVCCTIQAGATFTPPSCGLNNASINITITTSGYTPYTYSVDGINYQASGVFTNLAPGNYNAIAKDANACADTIAITIPTSANNLTVNTTVVDITCFGANDGTITATPAAGNSPYTFVWNNNLTTATIQNLLAGSYTVTVTDSTGCTGTGTASVVEPALLSINLGSDTTACEGTGIVITAPSGYAGYLWSTAESTQSIIPLVTGTYSVTVSDANNCTATDAVDITFVPAPVVDLGEDKIAYEDQHVGIFSIINQGQPSGGTYNWMPDTLLSCGDCPSPAAWALDTITYVLEYTDNYGCVGSDDIKINVLPVGDLFWPNAFTPNGDGNNDIFFPAGSGVKQIEWQLFNRWGEKVFESNSMFYGWDGMYKGKPLPMGVYVFTAKVVMMNDADRKFKGGVTLIR
jgi:gliding motility-associated-like protein